jgi:hypothetical protein
MQRRVVAVVGQLGAYGLAVVVVLNEGVTMRFPRPN